MKNLFILMLFGSQIYINAQDVHVWVEKEGSGKGARYSYTIENHSKFPITTLLLGNHIKSSDENCPDLILATDALCPDGWGAIQSYTCDGEYEWFFYINGGKEKFSQLIVKPGEVQGGFILLQSQQDDVFPGEQEKILKCRFTVSVDPGVNKPPENIYGWARVK